jgi:hypothetical protein
MDKLLNLKVADKNTSASKRLEKYLPEIEQALADGLSRKEILLSLNEVGFEMSMGTFSTMLHRLRKRLLRQTVKPSASKRPIQHNREVKREISDSLYDDRRKKVDHDLRSLANW